MLVELIEVTSGYFTKYRPKYRPSLFVLTGVNRYNGKQANPSICIQLGKMTAACLPFYTKASRFFIIRPRLEPYHEKSLHGRGQPSHLFNRPL